MADPRLARRSLFLAAAAVAGSGVLASCSFDKSTSTSTGATSGSTPGGKQFTVDTLNVNSFGPRPSFVNNFSPSSPAEGVVGTGYLYETLLWNDRLNANKLSPWLAKEFTFDRAARTMTITLRDDAKWSDGKPITADDVVYTVVEMPKQAEKQKANAETFDFTATKVDDLTVTFTWPEDKANAEGDRAVGNLRPKPKHVYEKQNLATWTNADAPVTSTPLTLERFTPQQVTFAVRDDHFNGPIPHVKKVNWVTFGSADVGKNLLLQGKMDLATLSIQNSEDTFVKQTEGNKYWTLYANSAEGFFFNCGKAPFNDVAVRKAVYQAIDTDKIHALYDIGLPSISPTGLDPQIWGDWVKPSLTEPHRADTEAAKKTLADAGWTVQGGNLTKDGKSYPISYKTVADYTNWSTWADGVKDQLKTVLGIDIKVLKVPDAQIWEQYNKGEFDMGMTWVASGTHMGFVYSDLDSKQAMPVGEEASANPGRVKDPELDALLAKAQAETDEAKLKELGYQIQQLVVDKAYIGPVNPGANFIEMSGKNWTGLPDKLEAGSPVPLPYGTADTWMMLQKLVPVR
ncbi:ABC transporter substrate-binding protein [Aestuariimicrobium kwangyangense]|uniref:ABC transporter substrate-binding protein n=1 Tax=Aestuariimicrobium kwangyangense TaxID=396389 RepID=UPI000A03EB2F|nr:ABC transporter substrate-binding protein [Aestuariimicrobium kwangyangense]